MKTMFSFPNENRNFISLFGIIRVLLIFIASSGATSYEKRLYSNTFVLNLPFGNTDVLKEDLWSCFSLQYKNHIHSDFYLFVKRDLVRKSEKSWMSPKFVNYTQKCGIQWTQEWYERISRFNMQRFPSNSSKNLESNKSCSHWNNSGETLNAIGVRSVLRSGISGNGVVVAVVDNGVELSHVDLAANVRCDLSYDFIRDIQDGNAKDIHSYPELLDANAHGTKCSGLIAAVQNGICSTGVAPNAGIASFVVIDSFHTVVGSIVSRAFSYKKDTIDVYSNSWGVDDDECGFFKLPAATQSALDTGAKFGRKGKGSIYVFPSGNGGPGDNCNADGYANNIHTVTIGAMDPDGSVPSFAEPCACVLAAVPMNGNCLTTTSLNNQCATKFVGTSAATAIAAGMIALTLETNPSLTKRDIDGIIVETADLEGIGNQTRWKINGAGKRFHDYFGFGQLNVSKMVDKARRWRYVSPQKKCKMNISKIRHRGKLANVQATTTQCEGIDYLEYVQVFTDMYTKNVDSMTILLTSPMGTRSELMSQRTRKCLSTDIQNMKWSFTSSQFWYENPVGTWELVIAGTANDSNSSARLVAAQIILYGYSRKYSFKGEVEGNGMNGTLAETRLQQWKNVIMKYKSLLKVPKSSSTETTYVVAVGAILCPIIIVLLVIIIPPCLGRITRCFRR